MTLCNAWRINNWYSNTGCSYLSTTYSRSKRLKRFFTEFWTTLIAFHLTVYRQSTYHSKTYFISNKSSIFADHRNSRTAISNCSRWEKHVHGFSENLVCPRVKDQFCAAACSLNLKRFPSGRLEFLIHRFCSYQRKVALLTRKSRCRHRPKFQHNICSVQVARFSIKTHQMIRN